MRGIIDPRYIKNNVPFETDTIIISPVWYAQMKWLKYTLTSYMKTGKYVLISYDHHLPETGGSIDKYIPPIDVLSIPHSWVFKHLTYDADKRNGWLWDTVYAAGIVKQFNNLKYIFTINGDCAIDRPEGINELIELLGDNDLMSQSSEKIIHTCSVIYKRDAFLKLTDSYLETMKTLVPESYSPEVLLTDSVKNLNLKEKVAPLVPLFPNIEKDFAGQVDHYSMYNEDSTWKQIIGFRNLGAESNQGSMRRIDPLPSKYYDLRNDGQFLDGFEKPLLQYYKTGDKRYLYKYWDECEDSWYDRRYFPVQFYGKEPIY